MMKKTVLSVFLIIALTSFQAIAAVPHIQFVPENLSLDLKWDASGITDKLITVTVADSDASLSADDCPAFAWVYEMPNDKQVDLDILLPAEIKSGTCYIYVDTKNEHHKLTSYVHNILSDTTKSICQDAYAISDAADFELYAASNAAYLGLDTDNEIISGNLQKAANLLYNEMSHHETQSPLNINKSAAEVTGFLTLGDSANIDGTVNSYAEILEIDSAAFAEKPAAVKNKFSQLVASKSNDQSDIKSIVSDCLILASLTVAENWSALKDSITENAAATGIDMSSTSKFATIPETRRYEVFVKLFETSSKLNSFGEFVTDFDNAVDYVIEKIEAEGKKDDPAPSKKPSPSVSVSGGFLSQPATPPTSQPTQTPSFNDIQGHFAESYINELLTINAVNGYEDGSFRPNGNVTKAEFVAMAVRTFAVSAAQTEVTFSDVTPADWYHSVITAMASNNIVSGYDGKFNPNSFITRQEAAVILSNLMSFRNIDASDVASNYNDSSLIADWAKTAVNKVTSSAIMQGDNNNFRPLDSITRGETAAVIARLAKLPGMVLEVTK